MHPNWIIEKGYQHHLKIHQKDVDNIKIGQLNHGG